MTEPFWKPLADDRDRYRQALKYIAATSLDLDTRKVAKEALVNPAIRRMAQKLKRTKRSEQR